ncbi:MAG TPA: MFS transporter [Gemmataceae bacterium]|jgi:ACS family tartrate transporter-like MFS transporter|nr:MFS transporter [Gemmataceae bacterium]
MTSNGSHSPSPFAERLIALIWRRPATDIAERTRRRVTIHLIPFLFFLYILAYLDRVNVSVAEQAMREPLDKGGLGFDPAITGFGAAVFFLGYWILEIPSTIWVVRRGARWVFVRILILWGICAALEGTIGTPFANKMFSWVPHVAEHSSAIDGIDKVFNAVFGWIAVLFGSKSNLQIVSGIARCINGLHDSAKYQFYFLRFMLGFFEGGFFPSVIVYLAHWFRTEDRAKSIACFMAAIPLSSMCGMPLSGLIAEKIHWFGLPGWRWIFILEGIAPILAGFATLFFLPDRPSKATWLPADERDWLLAELDREHKAKQGQGHWAWVHHLGIVLLLTFVYFCLNLTSYGLSMFMPAIIKSQAGVSKEVANYLASLPFALGFVGMLVNGWHSDRTGERPWHVAVPLALWSLALWLAAGLAGVPVWPALVMIFCVGSCMYAHLPAFWPIPTMFLGSTAAASAIGFINMIGNLGGSVGPTVVGSAATPLISETQPNFTPGLLKIAPWPMAAALVILAVGYARKRRLSASSRKPGLTVSADPASAAGHQGCEV